MKFLSVAVVAVLFCAASVCAGILDGSDGMRKSIKCGDDVFGELVSENKELEKFHAEYKELAAEANKQLDECEKIENLEQKEECVENVIMMFSMLKMSELITKMSEEKEEFSTSFIDLLSMNCE